MLRIVAGYFLVCWGFYFTVQASVVQAAEISSYRSSVTRHYVFEDKQKADQFVKEQKQSAKKVNLTTQKKPVQRFYVLLKGYTQWSTAFKQAQFLEKQGINGIEVVKGRFERGYSILVAQYANKKSAGKQFNKLRSMGLRNVRVYTDKVNIYQYIVTVHSIRPVSVIAKTVQPKTIPDNVSSKKVAGKSVTTEAAETETRSNSVSDEEETIILMSDNSNFGSSYEIALEDESESVDATVWGASFNLEEDLFTRDAQDASHLEYINARANIEHSINNNWELRLAARLDGSYQSGKNGTDYNDADLDYEDSYLRYRNENYRITVGTQTVRWGKVDNMGPLDNMATLDLSRGVMLKWGENYRSSPVIRTEYFNDAGKFDLVYLADFREAELADKDDVWYPIDFRNGRMLGFEYNPAMSGLIKNARIDDDFSGDGGWGMRYSTTLDSYDIGLTLQRIRLSTPYFKINEGIRQQILAGQVPNSNNYRYTFSEEHPRSWVIGGDTEFQWKSVTWRMEAGWFSDLPATTKNLKYETYDGFKWAGSAEFYPGDADTRVNIQLSGQHINEDEKILDLDNVVVLSGEVESLFDNNRWKASGRFNIGLSNKEYILSPEIAYLGAEPFEIYTAYHYMDGAKQTVGGFYKYNNLLTIGIRGKY